MNKPKTQIQEVLYCLINSDSIDRRQMLLETGILNVTARIAELRKKHSLYISCDEIDVTNKYGRKVSYGRWSLPNKAAGIEVYEQLAA